MRDRTAGQVLGHFKLISLLGRGGMGEVHLAEDTLLNRTVALKLLHADRAEDPARRSHLLAEARAAGALSHPGIATIYEVGEDEGLDYIAMEHVEGPTLRTLLTEAGPAGIPPARAIEYARQAAEALASAHERGLIHRDIKPENIAVTRQDRIKILDFGLARRIADTPDALEGVPSPLPEDRISEALTLDHAASRAGRITGTPAYMSPEQVCGQPLDARTDIYALGMVLHEMLSGHAQFRRDSLVESLRAIVLESPTPLRLAPGAPRALAALVARATSRNPEARQRSARELASELGGLQQLRSGSLARWMVAGGLVTFILILVMLLTWRARPRAGGLSSTARLRPLLVNAEVDEQPAIAPDGRRVSFTRDGNIFVVGVGEPSAQAEEPRAVTSGDEDDSHAAWSPDGSMLAFARRSATGVSEIWKVPASGGAATRVVIGGASPAWSPDGSRIAYIQTGLGSSTSVMTVGADGALSRAVTHMEDGLFHATPAWSPDGGTIAFVKEAGGGMTSEIWLVGSAGGLPRQLTREPDGIFSRLPCFTPDGSEIIYSSNRGGTINLWRMPAAGGEPVRLTSGAGADDYPRISADGRRVVFETESLGAALFVRDLSTGSKRVLLTESLATAWGPDISPDGASIAYTRVGKEGSFDLYTVPVAGGAARRLTSTPDSELWPRWSPDGTQLAYCTYSKQDDDIFVMPAGGGEARRLTQGGGDDWWPSWMPDGSAIIFTRIEENDARLYRVALAGGEPVRLSGQTLMLPSVSPDGRLVAVGRNRSYAHGVGVMPVAGGQVTWLTLSGGWPVFRPDGRAVGFIMGESNDQQSIWEVPVEGGTPRKLEGQDYVGWNWPFTWTRDGSAIVSSDDVPRGIDLFLLEAP